MAKELADRQTLYSDFISEATRLYADALTSSMFKVSEVVGIYALVSRIRLIAPNTAVLAAEAVVTTIIERYSEENLTLEDLSKAASSVKLDQLHQFSTTCRQDLSQLAQTSR